MQDDDDTKFERGKFEFADFAEEFDTHIANSIPGYPALRVECLNLSRRFVQSGRDNHSRYRLLHRRAAGSHS